MEPLSAAASIIAVIQLAGTVTQYLGTVKGAPKERQKILNELSAITGMLYLLKDEADEAGQDDSWNATLRSLDTPNGPLAQFTAALNTLATKLAPVDGLRKLSKTLIWPFQEKEIKEILNTIERLKGLFNLARQNDHIALTKALKAGTAKIQTGVDEISNSIAQIRLDDKQRRLIRWLDAPDPSTNHNKARKTYHPGTGSWLIEDAVFQRWTSDASSLIWLYGIPGCGKSVLSSTVVQYLLHQYKSEPLSPVLYYYFSFNESEKQRPENMIRSLLTQLLMRSSEGWEALDALHDRKHQPNNDELLAALHRIITTYEEVFVVIDALDECTDHPELLADIEALVSWGNVNLHLLTTSRRETDIEESLDPLCVEDMRICIQSADVNADIRSYVHDQLMMDRRFKRWQDCPDVQSIIESDLMEKAGGMFRWAACQLESLSSCLNLTQLRNALNSLPRTLDATYERILYNIDEFHRAYTIKLLQWLTFSARPLKLEELAEVIAIDPRGTPPFDPERRFPEPRDILNICSSLITLSEEIAVSDYHQSEDDDSLAESADDSSDDSLAVYVSLAHFSVQEYLISERIRNGKARAYSIQQIQSIVVIAEDCLTYLLQAYKLEMLPSLDTGDLPLADYAATFWRSHARMADESDTTITPSLSLELLLRTDIVSDEWFVNYCTCGDSWEFHHINEILQFPLLYASKAGLLKLAKLSFDEGHDVNDVNAKSTEPLFMGPAHTYSPLIMAAMKGHASVVKLLLEHGADIDFEGENVGSALYQACEEGHEAVVRLLLDGNANVHGASGKLLEVASNSTKCPLQVLEWLIEKGTKIDAGALKAACSSGYVEKARLLVLNGANVNTQIEGFNTSPLQAASWNGSKDCVEFLIEKGANVNAQGGEYGTALQAATIRGGKDCMELLLRRGAKVNAQGGKYGNALQAASSGGHLDCVGLLVELGADVNTQGGEYGNALQAASSSGHKDCVGLLVELGADVNTQGGKQGNALQAASSYGHKDCVKLLVELGADVNTQGGEYGNALQAASSSGHKDCVELLVELGADVNTQGGNYGNALQAALWCGSKTCVKLLVELGADVNTHGGNYGNALQAASSGRFSLDTTRFLLASGADVNAQGGEYGSALAAAFCHDLREVVDLLLDSGADVNAPCGEAGTALHVVVREYWATWANNSGYYDNIKLVLELGADVNALDKDHRTPLGVAVASEDYSLDVVQLLIENGADVNLRNNKIWTALHTAVSKDDHDTVQTLLVKGAEATFRPSLSAPS